MTFSNNKCSNNNDHPKGIPGIWMYNGYDDPDHWFANISEKLFIEEDFSFYQTEFIYFLYIDTAPYCASLWGQIEILNDDTLKFSVDSASPNDLLFDRYIPYLFNNDDTLHLGIYKFLSNERLYKFVRFE